MSRDLIPKELSTGLTPTVYVASHNWIGIVTVAIKRRVPVKDALTKIAATFKKYNPNLPFNYTFNDEAIALTFNTYVALTTRGISLLHRIAPKMEAWHKTYSGLTAIEIQQLNSLLRSFRYNLVA